MPEVALNAAFFDGLGLIPYWGQEEKNPLVSVKLTDKTTGEAWYVIEGSRQGEDYRFYGMRAHVPGRLCNRGCFRLSEFSGRQMTADLSIKGTTLGYILHHQFDTD